MSRPTLSVAASLARTSLAAGLLLGLISPVPAQTSTWTGGGGSDAWSDNLNWIGPTIPANGGSSTLAFAGTTRLTPNDDFATYTATAVTFDTTAGPFILGGNALALTGDITNNSAALQTINQNLNIDFTANRTIAAVAGPITIGGVIASSSGTGRLIKTGSSTLTLANNNTFTGGASILGGTLSVDADLRLGPLPAATPGYIVINGGTLQFTASFALANTRGIALGPTSGSGNGTIEVVGASVVSYNGNVLNNGGIGGLIKTGTGQLTLSATNSYSGPTQIQAGILQATNSGRIPTNTVVTLGSGSSAAKLIIGNAAVTATFIVGGLFTSGTGGAANAVVNGSTSGTGPTLSVTLASGSDLFDGTLGGGGTNENNFALTKAGAGTLILTGTNTYTGATTVNGGVLQFASLNNLGNGTAITFGGGTLQYASGNAADISGRTVTFNNAGGGGTIDTNGNTVTFANSVGNSWFGGLTKAGAGTLTLGPTNTYTGATTVAGGTLKLTGTNPTVASALIVAGTTPSSAAVLDVSTVSGGFQLAAGKTLGGHGSVSGPVTVLTGGTVNPGTTGTGGTPAGMLSFNNALTMNGTYGWDLATAGGPASANTGGSSTTGGVHDVLAVAGTLDLSAATLTLNSLGAAGATGFINSQSYSWAIATAGTVLGTPTLSPTFTGADFANLNGGSFSVSNGTTVLYLNFTPTPVPEPSGVLLGSAAAAGLAWWKRRRA